jgi:uncharacterized protein (TIGR02001 family)
MKFSKTFLASALLAATGVAQAEISANIAAVSDYYFRGVNQTNGAAVQGGLDYGNDSGFYLGTWLSNVDFDSKATVETDIYAGFAGELGSFGYDLSALYYWYPGAGGDEQEGDLDYAEVAVSGSYAMFTATFAYTVWGEVDNAPFDSGDMYYALSADFPLADVFSLSPVVGRYDFDNTVVSPGPETETASYVHWGAALAKDVGEFGSVSVNYDQTDIDGDDGPKMWLGWAKEF